MRTSVTHLAGILKAIAYELQPIRLSDAKKCVYWLMRNSKDIVLFLIRVIYFLWKLITNISSFLTPILIILTSIFCVGLYLSIVYDFMQLYFIMVLFILMMSSLGKRKKGELSAYSVFNMNQQRLLGTLTVDAFENEIRHGQAHPMPGEEENQEEVNMNRNNHNHDNNHDNHRRGRRRR